MKTESTSAKRGIASKAYILRCITTIRLLGNPQYIRLALNALSTETGWSIEQLYKILRSGENDPKAISRLIEKGNTQSAQELVRYLQTPGNIAKVADALGITSEAVRLWVRSKRIPKARQKEVQDLISGKKKPTDTIGSGIWAKTDGREQKHTIRAIQIADERKRRQQLPIAVRDSLGLVTFGAEDLQDVVSSLKAGVMYQNVVSIERDHRIARKARQNAVRICNRFPSVDRIKIIEGLDTQACQPRCRHFQSVAASRFNADYMGRMDEHMLRSLQTTIAQSLEMAPFGAWKHQLPFAYDFTVQASRSTAEDWDYAKNLIPLDLNAAILRVREETPNVANHYEKVLAIWAAANHVAQSHRVIVQLDFTYFYHEMMKLAPGSVRSIQAAAAMLIVGLKLKPPCGSKAEYIAAQRKNLERISKFRLNPENFVGYKEAKRFFDRIEEAA